MAGVVYIPEAEQLGPDTGGAMDTPNLPPRVVWHTVECPTGRGYFLSMASYLKREGLWPQTLVDPETDSLGQFGRLDRAGRALRNDGSSRTNRTGRVCIQVEVLGRAAQPFTEQSTWRPGPKFRALINAMRSWGIPDAFPMGAPPKYPGGSVRDRGIWLNRAGHFCHANVPGNDHGDPGAISPAKLWAAASGSTPPPVSPAPRKAKRMIVEQDLKSGFDPIVTLFNCVAPPESISVGCDMGDCKVRVDAFTNSGGWRFVGEAEVFDDKNLAFWPLPADTRKVAVKRIQRTPEDAAAATPARATLLYKAV